jgi:hypothetical protein
METQDKQNLKKKAFAISAIILNLLNLFLIVGILLLEAQKTQKQNLFCIP